MPRPLTYFFTLQSPWSYLGHAEIVALAKRHDLQLVWKPMDLLKVFPESGGLPLAKRHPKRQAYRGVELQRWRVERNLPLNLRPKFWPTNIALADCVAVALAERGADPQPFVAAAFKGFWAEDADVADEDVLAGYLKAGGHDRDVIEAARSDGTKATYERNTLEALDAGVFGAPTYVLDGEPFWGQDRIGLLDKALASGRPPLPI
jgi:2-hydroxychromene-2-carboxylate isomerase